MHIYRTHNCQQLRPKHAGEFVRLSGWIHRKRNLGGLLFIQLRDNYGITQIVIPEDSELMEQAANMSRESVVRFDGTVRLRPPEGINQELPTGEVELVAEDMELLNDCVELPFEVATENPVSEEIRLRYRFLELRREKLHQNILLRSKIIASIRRHMTDLGFHEFQTPIMTSSSPEGARDYLIPSRLHPGMFYALPQAPQQFKQLLMSSCFDRYFQIAACFRDEEARADRSPCEHYQLDIEMSFATQEDVFEVIEYVFPRVFREFRDWKITDPPFPRIPYSEAILKYGTDKPDLRNPLEILDFTDLFTNSDFRTFAGKTVRAIRVPESEPKSRSFFKKLEQEAKSLGAAGLIWFKVSDDGSFSGPLDKFFPAEIKSEITGYKEIKKAATFFFIADDDASLVAKVLGEIRIQLGIEFDLLVKDAFRFCWVTDFPMYERNAETDKIEFSHNPFSMPQGGLKAIQEQDPLSILAYQYDIVCNGHELSSGAVRNHSLPIMYKAFQIAGYDQSVVDNKFPSLQRAFQYGTPPHAGIAPGIDRIVMLLADEPNIRRIIAFPMNQRAQDLLMGAPAPVTPEQLKELHIKLDIKKNNL